MVGANAYRTLVVFAFVVSTLTTFSATKPAKVWCSVHFNKKSVMVGEPLLITVTLYTSTWFTSAPTFSEIQVPNSVTSTFPTRTGSVGRVIGGTRYSGIEKIYIVYPLVAGTNVLPSIKVDCESPMEGDYKGQARTVFSKEAPFEVQEPPSDLNMDHWLAAYDVQLQDQWVKSPDDVLVGDVLERKVTIRATGAMAALIPPIELDSLSFGSVYTMPEELSNVQNASSFTGIRTETFTYLIEDSGSVVIPAIYFDWYNLRSKQPIIDSIAAFHLTVKDNPNLDFIRSMQDSLQAMLANQNNAEEAQSPFEFLGLNWWQLSIVTLSLLALVVLMLRAVRLLFAYRRTRMAHHRNSEAHHFDVLMEAVSKRQDAKIIRSFWDWHHTLSLERGKEGFDSLQTEDEHLTNLDAVNGKLFSVQSSPLVDYDALKNELRALRSRVLHLDGAPSNYNLNPA